MQDIFKSLQELDLLYHSDSLEEYEQTWQIVAQSIRQMFPGFTLAYAELYTAGIGRRAHGGMRHVLFPIPCETSC